MKNDPHLNRLAEHGLEFAKDVYVKMKEGLLVPGIHTINDWFYTLEFEDIQKFQRLMVEGRKRSLVSSPDSYDYEIEDWIMTSMYLATLEKENDFSEEELQALTGMVAFLVSLESLRRRGLLKKIKSFSLYKPVEVELTELGKTLAEYMKEQKL